MNLFAIICVIACWSIHAYGMKVQIHLADHNSLANGTVVGMPVTGEIDADGLVVPGYAESAVPAAWKRKFQFLALVDAAFADQITTKLRSFDLSVAISFEPYGTGSMWMVDPTPAIDSRSITKMNNGNFKLEFNFFLRPRPKFQVILPTTVSRQNGLAVYGVLEYRNPSTGFYDYENRVINVCELPSMNDTPDTGTVTPAPLFGKYNLGDEVTVISLTAEGKPDPTTVREIWEIKALQISNAPYFIGIGKKNAHVAITTPMEM